MTVDEYKALEVGDLVRHRLSGDALVVVSTHPLIATRTKIITNPTEWDQVDKGGRVISSEPASRG